MYRTRSLARVNTVSFGFHVGRGRQRLMTAADQHNEIELNYVETGDLTFRHGPNVSILSQGSAILYWAAIPHQVIAVTPDAKILWLVLPLSWFLSWNLPAPFSKRLLRGEMMSLKPRETRDDAGSLLNRWADDFAMKLPEVQKILELEVEAFFRRLALQRPPTPVMKSLPNLSPSTKNLSYERIQQMVCFVTEKYAEPITIAQIADAARLNPQYAMRLFRKNWGMTLWDFLLEQRVFQAKRLLILGDAKVSDIALECGFNSASRFYSAFARYCGCTPLAFRRQAQGATRDSLASTCDRKDARPEWH